MFSEKCFSVFDPHTHAIHILAKNVCQWEYYSTTLRWLIIMNTEMWFVVIGWNLNLLGGNDDFSRLEKFINFR